MSSEPSRWARGLAAKWWPPVSGYDENRRKLALIFDEIRAEAKSVHREFVVTDYWVENDRPYRSMLHDEQHDTRILSDQEILHLAIEAAGAKDGDTVQIVAIKTGRRPFGDRRMVLVAPHTYKREE